MSEWWQQDTCYKRLVQETKLHSSAKTAMAGFVHLNLRDRLIQQLADTKQNVNCRVGIAN